MGNEVVALVGLATHLKEMRIQKNLLQSDLANACGVHVKTIGRIENGERNASLETALLLAQYLECNVEDIFNLD